jgi:lysophospholipase L1-like esterase
MSKYRVIAAVAVLCFSTLVPLAATAQTARAGGHWVSAWSAAVHAPLPFADIQASPVLENQTVRMVARPTVAGTRIRIRFSNAYGTAALRIGAAHIALAGSGASTVAASDRPLTFGGKASIAIPPGAPVLSDPVELKFERFAEVAVSLYLPDKVPASSVHFWAQHDTYLSGPGDFTAKSEIPNATTKSSWYWLSDIEVWAPTGTAATVAFGDSITDGVGAKQGEYGDWPDLLAGRLAKQSGLPAVPVLNEGIGGNRILRDGAGVSALARFDRDVLAQPGVVNLIVLEGINDLGFPHMKLRPSAGGPPPDNNLFADQAVTADDLIAGLRQLIDRAHQHGIRIFGATLTPFEGADYYSAEGEAIRQAVNQWIRTSGAFDGVFDFDAATRDPDHPTKLLARYDSGDRLHPSAAGFKAMAAAIDLSVLRGVKAAPVKK